MALADITRFPRLIIEIPEDEMPDNVSITMEGRVVPKAADGKVAQLVADAAKELLGVTAPVYLTTSWNESNFKKTINGNKVVNVPAPYDEIVGIVGYAHRDDQKDDTSINVRMYTTTQSSIPSSTSTTYNLQGVWAYQFTMTKKTIDAAYIAQYVAESTSVGGAAALVSAIVPLLSQIMASVLVPKLPTPKAIASKFLGPASAAVQSALATIAQELSTVKKTADQITRVVEAIEGILADPSLAVQYLPIIINVALGYVDQDKLSELVYEFRG